MSLPVGPTASATGLRRYAPDTARAHDRVCALSIVERARAVIYVRVETFITGFLAASYGKCKPRAPTLRGVIGPHLGPVVRYPPASDGTDADQQQSATDDGPVPTRRFLRRCRGSLSLAVAPCRSLTRRGRSRHDTSLAVDASPHAVAGMAVPPEPRVRQCRFIIGPIGGRKPIMNCLRGAFRLHRTDAVGGVPVPHPSLNAPSPPRRIAGGTNAVA